MHGQAVLENITSCLHHTTSVRRQARIARRAEDFPYDRLQFDLCRSLNDQEEGTLFEASVGIDVGLDCVACRRWTRHIVRQSCELRARSNVSCTGELNLCHGRRESEDHETLQNCFLQLGHRFSPEENSFEIYDGSTVEVSFWKTPRKDVLSDNVPLRRFMKLFRCGMRRFLLGCAPLNCPLL